MSNLHTHERQAHESLRYPLRVDTQPRAVWPDGLLHLEHQPTSQDRLTWTVDRYVDERQRDDKQWPLGIRVGQGGAR